MRLIDADVLEPHEQLEPTRNGYYEYVEVVYKDDIDDTPAIDAVPVVRCGECKHMMADGRCMEIADDGIRRSASDFCSYGERKEMVENMRLIDGHVVMERLQAQTEVITNHEMVAGLLIAQGIVLEAQIEAGQKTGGWVSVTERLPEEEGWYLVTIQNDKTRKRRTENDLFAIGIAEAHKHTPYKFCKDGYRQTVIAWMPLPEPYKEERDE